MVYCAILFYQDYRNHAKSNGKNRCFFDRIETLLSQTHEVVGKLVLDSIKHGKNIQDWSLEELKAYHPLIEADIYVDLRPETAVQRRHSLGGTGFEQVTYQIETAKNAAKNKK